MPTPFIDSLIAASELVLYLDPRSGPLTGLDDLSGSGNPGVGTDLDFVDNTHGVRFNAATSVITVADAAELQLVAGTLIWLGEFHRQAAEALIYKRDAGGTNYEVNLTAANVQLFDGTNTRFLAANVEGVRCVAVSMDNAVVGDVYINGVLAGALDNASAISVDNADLLLGNNHLNTAPTGSTLQACLIVNRQLTATEQAIIYSELANLTWEAW
jgi:hypothetical protein